MERTGNPVSEQNRISVNEGLKCLDIRTKTIDATLAPMLQQITFLVNKKRDLNIAKLNGDAQKNESIEDAIQTVQVAITQFVKAGEKVADEHQTIKSQMLAACKQANEAMERIIDVVHCGKTEDLVTAVKLLLTSVYKVLVLADSLVIREICQSKERVLTKLDALTSVLNFTEFLSNFTSFGTEMADFGKLTGDRQLDTKREIDAAKMACLRSFLEKSTALYLTSCKICLRHPSTQLAKDNRDTIVELMKKGLTEVVDIVCFAATAETDDHEKILSKVLQDYTSALEMCVILSGDPTSVTKAQESFQLVDEYVHDFTDSAYTPHEHRELIILSCQKCKEELDTMALIPQDSGELTESAISSCQQAVQALRKQLIQQTVSAAAELFGGSLDTGLLAAMRSAAQEGEVETVENISCQIRDHVDQIQEVCKQMQHVAPSETFYIRVKYTANYLLSLTELLLQNAEMFCCHAMSKVAAEGYSAMADAWVVLIGELAAASEELQDSLYQR